MKLLESNITQIIEEIYLVETLNLNNKTILELGCGNASMTKQIATNGFDRKVIACEVDEFQHKKNLELNLSNIEFKLFGAEDIKLNDNSVDIVFMFKSFHHIPKNSMAQALKEIKRVLKPNGLAYISEPLFLGPQNELIRIFHDEEEVRIDAFEAIEKSVLNEEFKLFRQVFFQSEVSYDSFEDFQKKQMNLSYNDNTISESIKEKVRKKYEELGGGKLTLLKPFRVDILQNI